MNLFYILLFLNALAFIFHGLSSIFSRRMQAEFRRFGMSEAQGKMTGYLQLLGATGLLLGLILPLMGGAAAICLALMMGVAFFTRIKVKDNAWEKWPSLFFICMNIYLFAGFLKMMG